MYKTGHNRICLSILIVVYCCSLLCGVETRNCSIVDTAVFECNGVVPTAIPDGVHLVTLTNIDLDRFVSGQFSHPSWNNTLYLNIEATQGQILQSDVFSGLQTLQHLKLKGMRLQQLERGSFRRLPNLEKLDLSDNVYLPLQDVLLVLDDSVSVTLPSLKWLNLADLQSFYTDPAVLNYTNLLILSKRNIEYLDFTKFNISPLDADGFRRLCSHLIHLVLKDTVITNPSYLRPYTCDSLRTVDVRNMISIDLMESIKYLNIPAGWNWHPFLIRFLKPIYNVETLLAKNILQRKKDAEIGLNFTVDFRMCPFNFRKIDLSYNAIRVFNLTISLHPITVRRIVDLDFSGNLLEYFSPRALSQSINTEKLNMSNNHLSIMMQQFKSDFSVFLYHLTKLKMVDLSQNGFTDLPVNMFITNGRLQQIYLADNLLTAVRFRLDNLSNLKLLDLRGNQIKVLSADVMSQFEQIFAMQRAHSLGRSVLTGNSEISKPSLYLHGNPLECKCNEENMNFLKWTIYEGFVHNNTELLCNFNGGTIPVFYTALQKTSAHCEMLALQKKVLIISISFLTVMIISFISVFFVRRQLIRRNALKHFIRIVRTGDKLKNLIFLSFCNEDGDYVLEYIYPQMKDEASKALECSRNLICCGDLNFRPGMSICLEAMRCIEESAVIIFVVSNTFCQKSWCKMEVDTANAQRKPVILLMLEKVKPEVMTPYMRKLFSRYTRASWIDDKNGGYPHPPWSVLISSVIELGSKFNAENQTRSENEPEDLNNYPEIAGIYTNRHDVNDLDRIDLHLEK